MTIWFALYLFDLRNKTGIMIRHISILGCGWLGLPLGQALAAEGYLVKGSSTRAERLAEIEAAGVSPFLVEAGEKVEGPDLGRFFETDLLFINIPPGGRRSPDVEEAYPRKIMAVMEWAARYEVQQVVFTSSTGVYGNEQRVLNEADGLAPSSASGRALQVIEQYLQLRRQPQVTILRLAGLVGGSRKPGRFLAGRRDVPNGEAPVNLVHLEDCIGLVSTLIRQEAFGGIFNVVADEHPTRAAFYTAQAEKEGLEPPTFIAGATPSWKIISNARSKERLGYEYLHPDPMSF